MPKHPRCGFAAPECSALSAALSAIYAESVAAIGPEPTKGGSEGWGRTAAYLWNDVRRMVDALGFSTARPLIRVGDFELCISPEMARYYHRAYFCTEPGNLPAKWRTHAADWTIEVATRQGNDWRRAVGTPVLTNIGEVPADLIDPTPAPTPDAVAMPTLTVIDCEPRKQAVKATPKPKGRKTLMRRRQSPPPIIYRAALRSYLSAA